MDFNFPFLDVLVLPVGATTGERIEIDGVEGEIRIYDANNVLRMRIAAGLPSSIEFFTGNVNEDPDSPAQIANLATIIGAETHLTCRLSSGSTIGAPDEEAILELLSRSIDGSEPPTIRLKSRLTTDDLRLAIADDASGTRTQPMGTAVLVAGTVTVTHSFVTASSRIIHWRQVAGGTLGHLSIGAIVAGTSFVINSSSATDTSTIGYLVVEPI
jgi:hypothetical protein